MGGDDAVRPEYPVSPPADWASEPGAARVLAAHREAIALRRDNPWLTRATVTVELLENTRITYVVRGENEGEALRVAADLGADPSADVASDVAIAPRVAVSAA